MTLDDSIHLPSPQEINHQEIPLTTNFLISSAMWLGKYCDDQSKEFMLCRAEEMDPRRCLKYGHELTSCGLEFFKKVKKTCRAELEWYTKCLDFSGSQVTFAKCRSEQRLFDNCMYDAGFERAKFGHFQLLRVHDSERPKPKPYVPVFPDASDHIDYYSEENRNKKTPRGGSTQNILHGLLR